MGSKLQRWPRKLRTLAANFFLLGTSLIIGLLLIEGALRLVYPASELGAMATHQADNALGWAYIPGSSQWRTSPGEFRTFVQVNSNGLRDEEIPYEKPADVYRIVMIGDSFVAGVQSTLDKTFVKVTERELRELDGQPGREIQVINAGTGGYGTDQELRWLRFEGVKYTPDMVVLVIYLGNDIADNDYELSSLAVSTLPPKPFFQLQDGQLVDAGFIGAQTQLSGDQEASILSVRRFLQKHSHAYRLASAALTNLEGQPAFQKAIGWLGQGTAADTYNHNYDIFNESPPPQWDRAWKLTEALILAMRDESASIGAQFRVVAIPHPVQVHQDWWRARVALYPAMDEIDWDLSRPNRQLRDLLNDSDVPYLDLQPLLSDYVAETDHYIYYRSDGHFTDEGNQIVGEMIAEWLVQTWQ